MIFLLKLSLAFAAGFALHTILLDTQIVPGLWHAQRDLAAQYEVLTSVIEAQTRLEASSAAKLDFMDVARRVDTLLAGLPNGR